jgi:hypothetical protein
MTHQEINQDGATWGPVVTAAINAIEKQCWAAGSNARECTDVEVYEDRNCYKVEFYTDDYFNLTIYDDGVWNAEIEGENHRGRIPPLHYKSWVRKMVKSGVHPGMAVFAVGFFKELKASP